MKKLLLPVFVCAALAMTAQERKIDLSTVKKPVFSAQINEKNAALPKGAKGAVTKDGIVLDYVFPSAGHDACMVEFPVDQPLFNSLTVELTVAQAGHRPFIVLTDKSGEKRYFSLVNTGDIKGQAFKKAGRFKLVIPVPHKNKYVSEKFAFFWGGDGNQVIDFPVKSVMLGLNDYPDSFSGSGRIVFHSITFR